MPGSSPGCRGAPWHVVIYMNEPRIGLRLWPSTSQATSDRPESEGLQRCALTGREAPHRWLCWSHKVATQAA